MRAALYGRVSTPDQRPDAQLDALRAYAAARGLEAREFLDVGVSGAKARRPGLDALTAAVRRREVDVVVCAKLDRLARSVQHLTALAADLEAVGVGLVVLDQAIDTTTPSGRFLFHTLGAVAELERDLIRERTRAGIEAARRRGARFGRPPATDGPQRARIRRLARAGRSLREIAALTGVPRSTVHRALSAQRPPTSRR